MRPKTKKGNSQDGTLSQIFGSQTRSRSLSSNEGEQDRDDELSPTIVKVIDRIARTLIDAFNSSVDRIVKGMEQQLTHRIDVQAREIYDARKQSN